MDTRKPSKGVTFAPDPDVKIILDNALDLALPKDKRAKLEFNLDINTAPNVDPSLSLILDAALAGYAPAIVGRLKNSNITAKIEATGSQSVIVVDAKQAEGVAYFLKGNEKEHEKKPNDAIAMYEEAVGYGHVNSKVRLGVLYLAVPEDKNKSRSRLASPYRLFSEAAALGDRDGMFRQAEALEQGVGVKTNLLQARKLYDQASQMGVPTAEKCVEKLNERLKHCDAILNLLPKKIVSVVYDKFDVMTLKFTSDEEAARVRAALKSHLVPYQSMDKDTVAFTVKHELIAKLTDATQFAALQTQIAAPAVPQVNTAKIESSPALSRGISYLDPENTQRMKVVIEKAGWLLKSEAAPVAASAEPCHTVVDKAGVTKFKIYASKLTTQENSLDTFKVMLESFRAVHEDRSLPKITVYNEAARSLLLAACKEVYADKVVDWDKHIFSGAVKPPALPASPAVPTPASAEEKAPPSASGPGKP